MERPEFVQHFQLREDDSIPDSDQENIVEALIENQRQAAMAQRLANIQSHLPKKVIEAFRLIADENLTLREAAKRVKVDEKTLHRWRKRIRGQNPDPI